MIPVTVLDRRGFAFGAGATAAAVLTLAPTVPSVAKPAPYASIVIADERHAASREFAAEAARSGARVVRTRGDLTEFWHGELDLLWRREKVALSGLTEHAAFFYLARLGMDRGLRVASKDEIHGLIRWTIAPQPRVKAFA